jgi:peptide/nickel transport system ATP-binding protein/oligopeptide transport system ATP-binding protein
MDINQKESTAPLLSVRNLRTYFKTDEGIAKAVDDVSMEVFSGEVLGIVGESGSGKSVAALSCLRLIPEPPGFIAGGEVMMQERDLLTLDYAELRRVRGRSIGMIFQEPMTSLNPVFTIGMQMMEPLLAHERIKRREAFQRAVEMLQRVGLPDAERRMKDYPHQLSGGMRQRVMIAMALICHPALLIADEPTTALDVTLQAQILDLMIELKEKHEAGSIILITHDLGVVAKTCNRVIVMYGGKVQETGTVEQIFDDPRHPYTEGLLASLPARQGKRHHRLKAIPGNVPAILDLPHGCKFSTRCAHVFDRCRHEEPPLCDLKDGRYARCYLMGEMSKGDG